MKRLIAAFIIVFTLFAVNMAGEYMLIRNCEEIVGELEICAEHINENKYEDALSHLMTIKNKWQSTIKLINLIIGDNEDNNTNITIIEQCIRDENYNYALSLAREYQAIFEALSAGNKVSLSNIL